jgi:hypothetical protein
MAEPATPTTPTKRPHQQKKSKLNLERAKKHPGTTARI